LRLLLAVGFDRTLPHPAATRRENDAGDFASFIFATRPERATMDRSEVGEPVLDGSLSTMGCIRQYNANHAAKEADR